jgi:peroxiredoxin Q/BCP
VNHLNFPLLADPDGRIAKAFGVPISDGGVTFRTVDNKEVKPFRGVTTARVTLIIEKDDVFIYKDADVNAADDSDKVLAFLQEQISE